MIHSILNKILGDQNEKELKKLWPIVKKVNEIEAEYQQTLQEEDIVKKTEEFKARVANGESLDKILPEAFALVKFACRHLSGKSFELKHLYSEAEGQKYQWNMVPYDVQILGGIILHQGKIAEMKTGEGKTLVCTMPLYLNALSNKGVYLVTVNEYLAQRDAEWMGILYNTLGLTTGIILHNQNKESKKAAYAADITYGTNNEFGFDYLRDNMSTSEEGMVQRELNFAIVDEVDSILIDEARTPLIISAPAEESTDKYQKYAQYIKRLTADEDYVIDEKQKTATLTEDGIAKMEQILGVDNIYTDAGFMEVHHLEQALKAETCFKKDIDYVVKDGEIIIVDEFTGRLMFGRRYSDGLHQAIEAKENVLINRESKTLATVTFQNYFRLFNKLAGMTGTAKTEAEEFLQIYGLDTIVVPTNNLVQRKDETDMIFKNQKGKYMAVVERVKKAYEKGQPVLIGTISIEKSELLSHMLQLQKIPHSVLNAKYHEQEAEIIAKAGLKGAVTIATNMAGRGTDIKPDHEAKEAGGLLVIGTERHESRRIDNQLRGRSGRQGDPGESQFFVSMEDDLMRLFGAEKIRVMMERLNVPDDMPIQNGLISNSIESAQKKVEGRNFDIRKHLVEYDDIMNKHREIIYSRRRKMLFSDNVKNDIIILIEKDAERIVNNSFDVENRTWRHDEILSSLDALSGEGKGQIDLERLKDLKDEEALIEMVKSYLFEIYQNKENQLTDTQVLRQIERNVYLSVIDSLWMEHIDNMQQLRESVSLRGYGQRDPLIEYKELAFEMFRQLLLNVQINTVNTLFKINLAQHLPENMLKTQTVELKVFTNAEQIKTQATTEFDEALDAEESNGQGIRVIKADSSDNAVASKKLGRNERCPNCGNKMKKCTCS